MCGIAGLITNKRSKACSLMQVRQMIETIKHRGPDGQDFYQDGDVALGHCRLKIIDLSEAGKQPMCNENHSIWLTYNGEIYNYKELKKDLVDKGHIFKSHTDSEVIIHAYEQWGEECLSKFNGMWAFIIWDKNKRKLFCARDRFGIKPFYYYYDEEKLIFGSEIKAILSILQNKPKLNIDSCQNYLSHSRTEIGSDTLYKGIKRLLPSHYLSLKVPCQGVIKPIKYWDFKINSSYNFDSSSVNIQDKVSEFYECFKDSIKLRLNSDVCVGSCLSGGLDSSAIVCTIYDLLKDNAVNQFKIGDRLSTFTACFDNTWCDEREYSEVIAQYCEANEKQVFPNSDDLLAQLLQLLKIHDEPFPTTSMLSQWNVMKLVSQTNVQVLLDGQGGDELLGGYISYVNFLLRDLYKEKMHFQCMKEAFLFRDILPNLKTNIAKKILKKFNINLKRNNLHNNYYSFDTKQFVNTSGIGLRELLKNNLTDSSIPDLLRYEDRNSMAFSIETRVPFLDHRLVELVSSLPTKLLLNQGWTKWILRESLKKSMPAKVLKRRVKLGFATPESTWIHKNKDSIKYLFNRSESIFGNFLLNRSEIIKDLDSILNIKTNSSINNITKILIFDLWLLNYTNNI